MKKRSEFQREATDRMIERVRSVMDGLEHIEPELDAMLNDVIGYIKAQGGLLEILFKNDEAVEPVLDGVCKCYTCGACGEQINIVHHYCSNCGREIKWDD